MRALLILLASAPTSAAPCAKPVADAARAAWGATGSGKLACTPVKGNSGLVLVTGLIDFAGNLVESQQDGFPLGALTDARGAKVVWQQTSYAGTPGNTYAFSLADLDGDGQDELIVRRSHIGHESSSSEEFAASSIRADEVIQLGTLSLGLVLDPKAFNACGISSVAIVGGRARRVQVVGTRGHDLKLQPAPDGCPLEGTHRYRLTGRGFTLAD